MNDDYDIVLESTAGYGHTKYRIVKNNTKLSTDELALICDQGNLCFGYRREGQYICVHETRATLKGTEFINYTIKLSNGNEFIVSKEDYIKLVK